MTTKQITERQATENLKYEVARKIREILDEARKAMPNYWTDEWEGEALELVCEEV